VNSLLSKAILYPFVGACLLTAYQQFGYFSHWMAAPENPARQENLAGAFLTGIVFSFAWLGALGLVFWKSEIFSKTDRVIAVASACAVIAGILLAVVLDFAT